MNLRVGWIVELLQHDVAHIRGQDFLRLADRPAHPFGARRQDQLGAKGLQQLAPLQAHGVGHHQQAVIAFGRSHQRQADAGVAAGRLHQNGVRPNLAEFLRRFDHILSNAVFDAGAGVEEFQLNQHIGRRALRHLV